MITEIHVTGDELNALNKKVGGIHMPKPITNEEWFCRLSTEEKAEWLYYHSGAMSSKGDWEDWLKEKHDGNT